LAIWFTFPINFDLAGTFLRIGLEGLITIRLPGLTTKSTEKWVLMASSASLRLVNGGKELFRLSSIRAGL